MGDYVIDITGDQYNVISTSKLNEAIVKNRPFLPVHVAHRKDSYLYILFKIQGRELLTYGFPTIGNDFIDEMECDYRQLVGWGRAMQTCAYIGKSATEVLFVAQGGLY